MSFLDCAESVTGHAQNDRSGKCCWCGRQIDPPCRFTPQPMDPSDLTEAYDTFYGTDDPEDRGAVRRRYQLGQQA